MWNIKTYNLVINNLLFRKLIGKTGRDIIGAGIAVYGPRTTCLVFNEATNSIMELAVKCILYFKY